MIEALKGIKPEKLWECFGSLTKIPRCSKHEEKVMEWLGKWCEENKLEYKRDKVNNLVVKIPAAAGYENVPTIILQGHTDMVCEKNRDCSHDFEKEPIKVIRDGKWIKADGTTLGADNGIGVAMGMALALEKDKIHGPIELLMTIDEETGLTGAQALESDFISGNILLNLDSEEEGDIYVGCAGGLDTEIIYPIDLEKKAEEHNCYKIMIRGLIGGHSGLNIHEGRGNGIKIAGRVIYEIYSNFEMNLIKISGGSKRNAIPRECEVEISLKKGSEDEVQKLIDKLLIDIRNELPTSEKNVEILFEKIDDREEVISLEDSKWILYLIYAIPHGVMEMSKDIEDLVETSTNLGVITTDKEYIKLITSQRSSINSARDELGKRIRIIGELAGCEVIHNGSYPGWKPDMDSNILKFAKKVWKEVSGKEANVKAIHAGLECGIIGEKFPGMDMISFGPDMFGVHSPDEKLDCESSLRVYNFLTELLKRFAEENK